MEGDQGELGRKTTWRIMRRHDKTIFMWTVSWWQICLYWSQRGETGCCEIHVFVRAAHAFVRASIDTVLHSSLYGPGHVSLVCTYWGYLISGDRELQHLHMHWAGTGGYPRPPSLPDLAASSNSHKTIWKTGNNHVIAIICQRGILDSHQILFWA